jgi:DNA polymerase-3 subunit gamma/tau
MALEDKHITPREVSDIIGATERQEVEKIADLIMTGEIAESLEYINHIAEEGNDLEVFSKSLIQYFREVLVLSVNPAIIKHLEKRMPKDQLKRLENLAKKFPSENILKVLDIFIDVPGKIKLAFIPQLPLEMAVVKLVLKNSAVEIKKENNLDTEKKFLPRADKNVAPASKNSEIVRESIVEDKIMIADKKEEKNITPEKEIITLDELREKWGEILEEIKPYNHSIAALLVNCQPVRVEGKIAKIIAKYGFYKDRLEDSANKLTIEKVFAKVLNCQLVVKFLTEEEAGVSVDPVFITRSSQQSATYLKSAKNNSDENSGQDTLLADAMNIMGGKIVEE